MPTAKLSLALLAFAMTLLAGCGNGDESSKPPSAGLPKEIVIGAAIAKSGILVPMTKVSPPSNS